MADPYAKIATPSASGDPYAALATPVGLAPKGRPAARVDPRRAARRDALRDSRPDQPGPYDTPSGKMLDALMLTYPSLSAAALNATISAAQRAVPGGVDPKYTWRERFDAERDALSARRQTFAAKHPIAATLLPLGGSLMMPGGRTIAKAIEGAAGPLAVAAGKGISLGEHVLRGGRSALVAGTLSAAQAAASAKSGEVASDATTAGMAGAMLGPLADAGISGIVKGAPSLSRTARGLASPLTKNLPPGALRDAVAPDAPSETALRKLVTTLRKMDLDPAAVQRAYDDLVKTGGVTPTMLDVLTKAGASPAVMRLLNQSELTASVRAEAARHAVETSRGVQGLSLKAAEGLPGGEKRTPAQTSAKIAELKAKVDKAHAAKQAKLARKAYTKDVTLEHRGEQTSTRIDEDHTAQQARIADDLTSANTQIDADLAAGRVAPPESPVAREEGAAAFHRELNAKYDASKAAYTENFQIYEKAKPETAVVDDAEIHPLFVALKEKFQGFDVKHGDGPRAVAKYIDEIKEDIAPGNPADWAKGDKLTLTAPMTVEQMRFMSKKMAELASKYEGEGATLALRVKKHLDDELLRFASENKIKGDPEIVDKLRAGITGYAEHQQNFGEGIAAKLTERKPYRPTENVVPAHQAGDSVFGESPNRLSLNKALTGMGDTLNLVSPEAAAALRQEGYGRVKPDDISKLLTSTGGDALLDKNLRDQAIAAAEATRLAEEAAVVARTTAKDTAGRDAEAAKIEAASKKKASASSFEERRASAAMGAEHRKGEAETTALSRKRPLEAKGEALDLGAGALTKGRDEFGTALATTSPASLQTARSGARGAVMDEIARGGPESGASPNMFGDRSTENLNSLFGEDTIQRFQGELGSIRDNAANAKEMAAAAKGGDLAGAVMPIGASEILYPKVGTGKFFLRQFRKLSHLNPKEQDAYLEMMSTPAASASLKNLKEKMLRKYPKASLGSPALVRSSGKESDPGAMDRLKEEYGLAP